MPYLNDSEVEMLVFFFHSTQAVGFPAIINDDMLELDKFTHQWSLLLPLGKIRGK